MGKYWEDIKPKTQFRDSERILHVWIPQVNLYDKLELAVNDLQNYICFKVDLCLSLKI